MTFMWMTIFADPLLAVLKLCLASLSTHVGPPKRCPRDNTYYSYTSGQHYYAQFSFRAFKFLRTHAYVYLQCKVIICPDNDYNSHCRQGCRFRHKRSLDSTYHTNTVTLGPIKLKGLRRGVKDSEKSKE